MTSRTLLSDITKLSKEHALGLARLKLHTVEDLLFYFPARYADERELRTIEGLVKGQAVTLYGLLEKVEVKRSFRGHIPMTTAKLRDNSGTLRITWFNQAYIGKMYPEGTRVVVSGIIQEDSKGQYLTNPTIDKAGESAPQSEESLFANSSDISRFLIPIYRETKGVSSLYLYELIKRIFTHGGHLTLQETIPEHIRADLNLPSLHESLLYIHFPKTLELTQAARKRFSFEEIFYIKLRALEERSIVTQSPCYKIQSDTEPLLRSFPFSPTNAQRNAISTIHTDLGSGEPMSRLLEGDVGSGKTFVAAITSLSVCFSKNPHSATPLQVAYMAPTEILAEQQFATFTSLVKGTSLQVGLITSSGCKKFPSKSDPSAATPISRAQLLKWVKDGSLSILVGTHSLIQKSVVFKDLALIIIDEQHRFGVNARKTLAHKKGDNRKEIPHLLSMTATPIPRTLALTMFGDLDLTILDEVPKHRKQIMTKLVHRKDRATTYEAIRSELKSGRQVYVICPRIEGEDDGEQKNSTMRNVLEESKHLAEKIFPEFIVDTLHGKMKPQEKEAVLRDFLDEKSHILVSTTVVEVGMNVPNATVMLIEGAERFGLAQLHQLRGRVGRGEHQSYCYVFSESESEITAKRLASLIKAKNGFELAELDMMERGIGALIDGKQWGVSDIAMEALKNPKLVELATKHAKELLTNDPRLENFLEVKEKLLATKKAHME